HGGQRRRQGADAHGFRLRLPWISPDRAPRRSRRFEPAVTVTGKRPASEEEAVAQVVVASHIAAAAGYEDLTLGHVSVRGPDDETMFIKRKGMSLGSVGPEDVVRVDLRNPEALGAPGMHLEA